MITTEYRLSVATIYNMWGVTPVATPEPCPWDAINDSLMLKVIPLADKEGRAEQFLHVYISQT